MENEKTTLGARLRRHWPWLVLVVLSTVLHFWGLGERSYHHDEAIHAHSSYNLLMPRGQSGEPQMKLVAARSWIYDRYLEEFNVAEPVPGAVRAMVEQQRSHRSDQNSTGSGGASGTAGDQSDSK